MKELLRLLGDVEPDLCEEYLAATCLLRSYGIIDGDITYKEQHLLGAYSLAMNDLTELGCRGFPQVGAWNYLREEKIAALQLHRSERISMYVKVDGVAGCADDIQVNAITYILTQPIILCFEKKTTRKSSAVDFDAGCQSFKVKVQSWRENLPASFEPFSLATKPEHLFPPIWMLRPGRTNSTVSRL